MCCVVSMLLLSACQAVTGIAQDYPNKPVRMIVGFSPGGGTDIVARIVAPGLGERFRQQVIVDNRPGATGTIAALLTAKAPPDGYTLLMGSVSSNAIAASAFVKLPYDCRKDFAPVSLAASIPHLIVAHPSLGIKSIKDFVAFARANPGKLAFPSVGSGSSSHLAGEVFKMMAGVDLLHVPYKGAGQSVQDQLSGQIPLAFNTVAVALPYVKSGNLTALAVLALQRSPLLPDVPTIGELGLPGAEATTWYGVFAPANTPQSTVMRIHADVNAVIGLPDVRKILQVNGADQTVTRTPDAFAKMVDTEIEKYAKVVRIAGVRSD